MQTEIDILRDVTSKFDVAGIQYMLTGSLALSYYSQPRMTRDIDLVVKISPVMVDKMVEIFKDEYYISSDSVKDAVENEFMFNPINYKSSIKVDCFVRKKEEYRIVEFNRRNKIHISVFDIYIVSMEDLIISKLLWVKESNSELQKKDINNLLSTGYDEQYLTDWIEKLKLNQIYHAVKNE
jgi:hypothetical protein